MKKTITLLLSFILLSAQVHAEAFKAPDILVDSKLDFDWSGLLVKKIRRLLKNYKINDPFKNKFDAPIVVSQTVIENYLSPDSRELVNDLGAAIGLNILKGQTKVVFHNFAYDIKGFKTSLKSSVMTETGPIIASDFTASQLNISADKVTLSLMLPVKGSSAPLIEMEITKPVITARAKDLINFFAKVKIEDRGDHHKLNILESDFENMSLALGNNPQGIEFSYEGIRVPSLSVKVGNKLLNVSPEKIERLLREKDEGIKGLLVAQFASMLKKGTGENILKILEKYKINKEYWLDSKVIKSQILISQFASSFTGNNLQINMPGDFCTAAKFGQLNRDCLQNKQTQVMKSRLTGDDHDQSLHEMKSLLENGDANIVASISEDYINKLLVTTYDAGLWKNTLDEAGVDLGPSKVFLRLDGRGNVGSLFMDVVYKPKTIEKVVTGSSMVRFPLVMKVSLRIEKRDDIPVFIIKLRDVDLSDKTLLNGRPDVGMVSSIQTQPRLKKKVMNTIRTKIAPLIGKDVLDLRYPDFKGVGLENIEFSSDGNGRMNAVMRLQDFLNDDQ